MNQFFFITRQLLVITFKGYHKKHHHLGLFLKINKKIISIILINVFKKPAVDATRIMLEVHKKGMGICGVYIYDVAVSKINQVHQLAKENEFPLRCSYEEV